MMTEGTTPRWKTKRDWRSPLLRALAAALGLALALTLVLLYIPARIGTVSAVAPELAARFTQQTHNLLGQTLDGYTYIRKHYRISAGAMPAEPLASGYGASDDPEEILAVIRNASELLGEQTVVGWTPETVLRPGSQVQYYYDETILALTWQELDRDRICTWCEVKLSDPSQLRRKLAGDEYASPVQLPASVLARQDNAVAAVSGDFYAYRTAGIHVNNGLIYLVSSWNADTCFFTRSGNMLFSRRNEIRTWEQAAAFVRDNDVAFSVAFGPVLVENGEIDVPRDYLWGENYENYSRAVLSQVGELHYLFLAANSNEYGDLRFTAPEVAQLMIDHGCTMAYAMDGGQTAEVILGGRVINRPEFNMERQVSDVLCFASALPEGGVR